MLIFDYEILGVCGGRDSVEGMLKAQARRGYRYVGSVPNVGLVFERESDDGPKVDVSIPPPAESSPAPPNPSLVASGRRGRPRKTQQ